jgi:hypothetical protein
MIVKNEELGIELVLIDVVTQGHVEKLLKAMPEGSFAQLLVIYHGALLRAAIQAEWILAPEWKVEDVADMSPAVVRWAAEQVDELYGEAISVPPS